MHRRIFRPKSLDRRACAPSWLFCFFAFWSFFLRYFSQLVFAFVWKRSSVSKSGSAVVASKSEQSREAFFSRSFFAILFGLIEVLLDRLSAVKSPIPPQFFLGINFCLTRQVNVSKNSSCAGSLVKWSYRRLPKKTDFSSPLSAIGGHFHR